MSKQPLAKEKKTFTTPLKEKGKKERRVKKLEELIEKSQEQISLLTERLSDPKVFSDYVKVTEIQEQLDKLQLEQNEYSEEWLMLCEELENL